VTWNDGSWRWRYECNITVNTGWIFCNSDFVCWAVLHFGFTVHIEQAGQIITQLSLVLLENDKLSYLDYGPVPVFEKPDGCQCSVAAGNREIF